MIKIIKWFMLRQKTTLHEIILDSITKGVKDSQIKEETLGLADSKMIEFYRNAMNSEKEIKRLNIKAENYFYKGYNREYEVCADCERKYNELLENFTKRESMYLSTCFKMELTDDQRKRLVALYPNQKDIFND